jgi:serine protease Do
MNDPSSRRAVVFPVVLASFMSVVPLAGAQTPQQPAIREAQLLPTLAPLVDSVKTAVVNVDVLARVEGGNDQQEFFEHFFGGGAPQQNRERVRQGAGSGFIIDSKGIALTNNHVVEGATSIRVRLDDGRTFDAEVLGRDPATDVAVIKLKGKVENLPVVKLGDSEATRVGDWVLAIGNPFGLASSVSLGIVSAKARNIKIGRYDDFIQTDAAINPGNSGGPLFNMKGEVVGINTAIVGGGASGIGFAVPSSLVKALLPQLQQKGSVTRGWLGIGIQDLTTDIAKAFNLSFSDGAVVIQVNDGSPAKKAGLQVDDVVTAIDGEKVGSGNALTRIVALKPPGSSVKLSYWRNGKQQEGKVQLGTRPDLEGEGKRSSERRSTDDEEVRKARIGLVVQDIDPRMARGAGIPAQGALIAEVSPGSPADRAELREGMIVVEANHKPVRSADELLRLLKAGKPGEIVLLRVIFPGDSARFVRALRIP